MPDRRVAQLTCSALFVDSFHHRAELDLAQLLPLERGQQVPPTTAPIIGSNDALNIRASSSSSIPT